MSVEAVTHAVNVRLGDDRNSVVILDQTLLPNETRYLTLSIAEELWQAIYLLQVRGAPAIGIFAAYSMAVLAQNIEAEDFASFRAEYFRLSAYLNSSRPTAVNLAHMLKRMEKVVDAHSEAPRAELIEALFTEAKAIHDEDIAMCRKISEYGLSLLKDGDGVITHCNAGPIATSRYGTGQGPFYLAKEKGVNIHVFVDETRPLLQGARLTSYELTKAGVDCTLICDNMASIVMKQGKVQAVFFGCDRIWGPPPPSTSTAPPATIFPSKNAPTPRSRNCSTKSPWRCRRPSATTLPLMSPTIACSPASSPSVASPMLPLKRASGNSSRRRWQNELYLSRTGQEGYLRGRPSALCPWLRGRQ